MREPPYVRGESLDVRGFLVSGVRRIRDTLRRMIDEKSPTAAATRARMRASEEKAAARLRERGWLPIPPEKAETAARLLAGHEGRAS